MLNDSQREYCMGISSAEARNTFNNTEPQIVELAVIGQCSGSVILPAASMPKLLAPSGKKQKRAKAVAPKQSSTRLAKPVYLHAQRSQGARRAA